MGENKRKPDIRFQGFIDDWEQRKLIEICDYVDYRGKTPVKTEDGIFLVTAKNVKDGYIDYEASKEYISEEDYEEVMHRGKPEFGDVLITTEAPCGNVAQVNRTDIALAQRIIKYRGHENIIDNTFLKYYLLAPEFQTVLMAKSSGGTVKGIKGSILHQQEVKYPQYEEQIKIGSYLDNIDNLITLHQRKYDKLVNVKKSMLEKMFPREGEKVPEIRFEGFTDDWEQRKVSEITKFHKQGFYTTEDYDDNKKFYLLRGTDLTENKLILKDTPKINATDKDYQAFKTEIGDFLIVRSGTVGTYGIVYDDIPAIFGSYLIDFRFDTEQVTNEFFGYFYQSDSFKKQLNQIVQRSANTNINAENIKSTSIMLPSLDEQKKISGYLDQLDNLITLHQRKLEKLKNIKKSMLEKMFV